MKKAENVLESPTAQETKELDWSAENKRARFDRRNKNDRVRARNETEEDMKLWLAKRRERDRARRAASLKKKLLKLRTVQLILM